MARVAAASVGPVLPADTSASARPSATAAAARTIDASGLDRTARTGSSWPVILSGESTTSGQSSWDAGPNTRTRWPDRRAPSATTAGPASAPFASSAITGARYSSEESDAGAMTSRPA